MKVKVVLKLDSTSNANILVTGPIYVTYMTDNDYFAAPEIVAHLPIVTASIGGLRTTMELINDDGKTGKVKVARELLDRNLSKLGNQVENTANDPAIDDSLRIDIVHSAGMDEKNHTNPRTQVFTAKNSDISGVVDLGARRGDAVAHAWKYCTDLLNFTNPQEIEPTTESKTSKPGLTRKTEYAFFHKPIIPGVISPWEGPIFLVIT